MQHLLRRQCALEKIADDEARTVGIRQNNEAPCCGDLPQKAEQPPVPEKAAPKRDELDDLLDQLMKKEPAKEAVIHANPTGARRAESSPSVPSSMTAEKAKSCMSVREELTRIRAEQQKQSTKPVQQHKAPRKKKRKER